MFPFIELTPTQKLLMMARMAGIGAMEEDSAEGNPVEFLTDLSKPLKSLVANFFPIQASGTPSPENILPITGWTGLNVSHGVKNLFAFDETKITQETTNEGKTRAVYHTGLKRGSYALSGSLKEGQTAVVYGVNEGIFKDGIATVKNTFITPSEVVNRSLVVGADEEVIFINTADSISDMKQKLIRYNLQIELGSSATSYEVPNITVYPVIFPALGKNLLNPAILEQGGVDSDGSLFNSVRRVRTGLIPVEVGKRYVCTANTGIKRFLHFYSGSNVSVGSNYGNAATAPEGSAYVRCIFGYENEDNLVPADVTEAQLEQSDSSSSPYEPFINTLFGGYYNMITGELWATWAGINKKWSDGESETDMGSGITRKAFPMVDNLTTGSANNMCNIAPYSANENAETHFYYSGSGATNRKARLFLPTETDGDTQITIITKLSAPVLIAMLSPQLINSIKGNNTIWSDANGNVEVTFLKKA